MGAEQGNHDGEQTFTIFPRVDSPREAPTYAVCSIYGCLPLRPLSREEAERVAEGLNVLAKS